MQRGGRITCGDSTPKAPQSLTVNFFLTRFSNDLTTTAAESGLTLYPVQRFWLSILTFLVRW